MGGMSDVVKRELKQMMIDADIFLKWEAASEDKIKVKRIYIDLAGDLAAGILLSQLVYWHLPSKKNRLPKVRVFKDGKMWIAKTREEWWEECRLSDWQVRRSIKTLKNKGIIEKKIFNFDGKPTTHIHLKLDNLYPMIIKLCHEYRYDRVSPDGFGEILQIHESVKSSKSITETTTETTTDICETRNQNLVLKTLLKEQPEILSHLITRKNHDCDICEGIGMIFVPGGGGTGYYQACECTAAKPISE